eukprot:CAMPEP_0118706022 /NCGR_PEP_ID=MMETSP0800-20121206/20281_1 /TAXON_ID=210618 ORGANISM="Striatella unipunctata, Strain CCMP2910" /NCGR_SAMPLE_ID=MMETSP0800 /ASSEMBLY_ACC=CAM_ASM_000638 /LENGTH=456 /DNA_ID=CAMNT_0006608419 /DNA_START=208 /DNA_END=1578 /DNA_ORIENTATION=-
MTNAQVQNAVVYLTGSTGFLGGMLVHQMDSDDRIQKIYCPVRAKGGATALERFHKSPLAKYKKCHFAQQGQDLPHDTTHVILNAYNTRFVEDLGKKLEENVVPMLSILDTCDKRKDKIQGITVVSTAYMQPPLPFAFPEKGRVPFIVGEKGYTKASEVFDKVMTIYEGRKAKQDNLSESDTKTNKNLKLFNKNKEKKTNNKTDKKMMMKNNKKNVDENDEYFVDLHPYYKKNTYALSKLIMEHLITERYPHLPITFARPSIVTPDREGTHGLDNYAAASMIIKFAPKPVFLAPRCSGMLNTVFVEDCAHDIIEGALMIAKPAIRDGSVGVGDNSDKMWHPIIMSTSNSVSSLWEYFHYISPNIKRLRTEKEMVLKAARVLERFFVRMSKGKKQARRLFRAYEGYDMFSGSNWSFPANHLTERNEFIKSAHLYLEKLPVEEGKVKMPKKRHMKKIQS